MSDAADATWTSQDLSGGDGPSPAVAALRAYARDLYLDAELTAAQVRVERANERRSVEYAGGTVEGQTTSYHSESGWTITTHYRLEEGS